MTPRINKTYLTRICSIVLLLILSAGCLVPDKYNAVLSLSNHAYSLTYTGNMHMMAAYSSEYAHYDPHMLAQKVMGEFTRVIKHRPNSRVSVAPISDQTFYTDFQYISTYAEPEATGMFALNIDGDVLTVTSRPLSELDKETLRLNKITSSGTLCIKAFGTVLSTNAQKTANAFDRCNKWNLNNLNEPVRLTVRFSKKIPLNGILEK